MSEKNFSLFRAIDDLMPDGRGPAVETEEQGDNKDYGERATQVPMSVIKCYQRIWLGGNDGVIVCARTKIKPPLGAWLGR